jgi:hypothetical protein
MCNAAFAPCEPRRALAGRVISQHEGRIFRQGNLNPRSRNLRLWHRGIVRCLYLADHRKPRPRFIRQVMSDQPSVRAAEDLEGGGRRSTTSAWPERLCGKKIPDRKGGASRAEEGGIWTR